MANKLLLIAGALPFNTCSMAGPTSLLSDLPGWFPSEGNMGQPPRLGLEWTGQMWGCGSGHLAPGAAGEPQVALGRSLPIPADWEQGVGAFLKEKLGSSIIRRKANIKCAKPKLSVWWATVFTNYDSNWHWAIFKHPTNFLGEKLSYHKGIHPYMLSGLCRVLEGPFHLYSLWF